MSDIKGEDLLKFEREYQGVRPNLERFAEGILEQIKKLIENENLRLGFPIEVRIKEWESILDKIRNRRFNIKNSIMEFQDLVGLRIILLFRRDIDAIMKSIKRTLVIKKQYEAADRLREDQFGYSSFHCIVTIPDSWLTVPSFSGLKSLQAEIQIRTLSQHIWAEASQFFQYKIQENVPRPLLRSIGRVSALLETVDIEFDRLLRDRENYKTLIDKPDVESKETLNVDMLEALLDKYFPKANKKVPEPYSELIEDLEFFNIKSINTLVKLIEANIQKVTEEDAKRVEALLKDHDSGVNKKLFDQNKERIQQGVFYMHAGLIRNILKFAYPDRHKEWSAKRAAVDL